MQMLMSAGTGDAATMERREFLRRAALVGVATASATWAARSPRALASHDSVPPLDVIGVVHDVAATSFGLLAVGAADDGPAAWTYRTGAQAWNRVASANDFPEGTSITTGVEFASDLFTAGSVTKHVATGRTITDENQNQVEVIEEHTTPAVFRSADSGNTWERVVSETSKAPAAFLAVSAVLANRLVVVGGLYPEVDVEEPHGLLALASSDGQSWREVSLNGVTPPSHGDASLFAHEAGEYALATSGFNTTKIYFYSSAENSWDEKPAPKSPDGYVSLVALGAADGEFLIAGVDQLDRARYWRGGSSGWREVPAPNGVLAGSKVTGFESYDEGLVAAGQSDGGKAYVREVE